MTYTYPDYTEYDETFPLQVQAEKARLLGRLAAGSVSYLELACLPHDNTPLQSREIIDAAIIELEQTGSIRKTYEVTDQQNVLIGYELA